ncbi:hypothetical protein G6F38_004126 [Rhizopus arrhizus]|nr:hypothetical protein G6F38_004126 [Rhizopus arrhizus]
MSTNLLYEDGYGKVVEENVGPELMGYIIDQSEFIAGTIATHTEHLKTALLNESLLTCPMLKKPKYEGIRLKEANTKRYTVQVFRSED